MCIYIYIYTYIHIYTYSYDMYVYIYIYIYTDAGGRATRRVPPHGGDSSRAGRSGGKTKHNNTYDNISNNTSITNNKTHITNYNNTYPIT